MTEVEQAVKTYSQELLQFGIFSEALKEYRFNYENISKVFISKPEKMRRHFECDARDDSVLPVTDAIQW